MKYQILTPTDSMASESGYFLEGLTLAANMATKPLDPDTWLTSVFSTLEPQAKAAVEEHITLQYQHLKANEYSLLGLIAGEQQVEHLADVAEGFMTLWPTIEEQWQEAAVGDGTVRMLQALLTCFMLAIDEEQTQAQMQAAGIDTPPTLEDFIDQLDLMLVEVAQGADEIMIGAKSQSVNPYKEVGRNDSCPCGSGRKFKQCCGK